MENQNVALQRLQRITISWRQKKSYTTTLMFFTYGSLVATLTAMMFTAIPFLENAVSVLVGCEFVLVIILMGLHFILVEIHSESSQLLRILEKFESGIQLEDEESEHFSFVSYMFDEPD